MKASPKGVESLEVFMKGHIFFFSVLFSLNLLAVGTVSDEQLPVWKLSGDEQKAVVGFVNTNADFLALARASCESVYLIAVKSRELVEIYEKANSDLAKMGVATFDFAKSWEASKAVCLEKARARRMPNLPSQLESCGMTFAQISACVEATNAMTNLQMGLNDAMRNSDDISEVMKETFEREENIQIEEKSSSCFYDMGSCNLLPKSETQDMK